MPRCLTVIHEPAVAAFDGAAHTLTGGATDEFAAFPGVAHDAVEDGAPGLRALLAHVVAGLVYNQPYGPVQTHCIKEIPA